MCYFRKFFGSLPGTAVTFDQMTGMSKANSLRIVDILSAGSFGFCDQIVAEPGAIQRLREGCHRALKSPLVPPSVFE